MTESRSKTSFLLLVFAGVTTITTTRAFSPWNYATTTRYCRPFHSPRVPSFEKSLTHGKLDGSDDDEKIDIFFIQSGQKENQTKIVVATNDETTDVNDTKTNDNHTTTQNTTVLKIKKSSIAQSLTGISSLQVLVVTCFAIGKVPLLNGLLNFCLGKGALVLGLVIIGLAAKESQQVQDDYCTTGLFSVVRHPSYSGQILTLLGLAHLRPKHTLGYFLVTLYYLVVRKKMSLLDYNLSQTYGTEYELYKVLVKGKLLPYAWAQTLFSNKQTSKKRASAKQANPTRSS
jgi:protein-S-isoprenylcysteine O-methyltransferase Ste14